MLREVDVRRGYRARESRLLGRYRRDMGNYFDPRWPAATEHADGNARQGSAAGDSGLDVRGALACAEHLRPNVEVASGCRRDERHLKDTEGNLRRHARAHRPDGERPLQAAEDAAPLHPVVRNRRPPNPVLFTGRREQL